MQTGQPDPAVGTLIFTSAATWIYSVTCAGAVVVMVCWLALRRAKTEDIPSVIISIAQLVRSFSAWLPSRQKSTVGLEVGPADKFEDPEDR